MAEAKILIDQVYRAFNSRDITAALALMTEDVSWPKASEGGEVTGKVEIRAYWLRQWSEFNPTVLPKRIVQDPNGDFSVSVHQVVKDLEGHLLFDGEVQHIYRLRGDLIASMVLGEGPDPAVAPSTAFVRRE